MWPSDASDCHTKWNWSELFQMSLPLPCTVQVPPLRDWLPAMLGYPISAQLQLAGQGADEKALGDPVATAAYVAVSRLPALSELLASPAMNAVGMGTITVLPSTCV